MKNILYGHFVKKPNMKYHLLITYSYKPFLYRLFSLKYEEMYVTPDRVMYTTYFYVPLAALRKGTIEEEWNL